MNVGAFVCSCGGTCDLDLEGVREGVRDVDVVASSRLLCRDGLDAMGALVDEYDLDQIVATATDDGCQRRIRALAEEKGLHPEATAFVDHREQTSWVHSEAESTDKTARLINATTAGLREEAPSRFVSQTAGDRVAVVADPDTATALADTADVTLVAHGHEFAGVSGLDDVAVERGRVVDVDGEFGSFTLTLEALVTEDCISCMECVEQGPEGAVTARPVDISPRAPEGDWLDCCPTDAIDRAGVRRTIEVDQVIYPGASNGARGGRIGFYTGPVDAATIASVEHHLGGVEKPKFLDVEMDVCAAGESSQRGCTACVDACPHDAVDRPKIDEVAFDEVACMNCGACTSSCPTGAVQLREPSNRRLAREVEALLDAEERGSGWLFDRATPGIETPVVAFVCSEYAADALREYGRRSAAGDDLSYAPILPVRVNCTDTVGEGHALHALAAGADGVAIVGCGSSCLHSGPDPKAALVDRLNRATTDLGLGERVTFLAPEADDPSTFVAELDSFVDGLAATPVPAGDYESTGVIRDEKPNPEYNTHDWALESIRAILDHSTPERDVIRGLETFGRMEVSDACNLTPTCSTLCPTDSIRRTDEGDLQFNHEDCVNCGLCEEGCPETAITMRPGLDLSLLPEHRDGDSWSTVYEGEMLECVRCGKPFTSRGSADKVIDDVGHLVDGLAPDSDHSIFEYCGNCRATLMFEQGGQ